jgi:putative ABC transport system permease protein
VQWAIPLALGDSHKGFRVVGTNEDYFRYFRYGEKQQLSLAQGRPFAGVYETVLGAEVARKLGYQLDQQITLSHGVGQISFAEHKDQPFTVVGILAPTGTPVDHSVHVSLQGIEAIHIGWQNGMPSMRRGAPNLTAEQLAALQPKVLTGALLGLKSKVATFAVQRQINDFKAEPLTAILPGAALAELWQMLSMVENLLLVITALVLLAAFTGMITNLLASQRERSRELAILRSVGARPWQLFVLIELEVLLLTVLGLLGGFALLSGSLALLQPVLSSQYGLVISLVAWHAHTPVGVVGMLGLALLLGSIPAFSAYRQGLSQGLQVRL